uniref:Uncharacterized protein n=1 Tax=Steinernema glaseri TaxID=37863 RepID=A0A1I7ZPZ4_9BILA
MGRQSTFVKKLICSPGFPFHNSVPLVLLLAFVSLTSAAGGISEMKAITGDAPYLGTGNQEIAGEYYVSRGEMPYSSYYSNYAYNRPYYQNYSPCRRSTFVFRKTV